MLIIVALMEKLETLVVENVDFCQPLHDFYLILNLMDITVQRIFQIWLYSNIIFRNTTMWKKFQTCSSYLNLNLLERVIKETLRLFPSRPIITRKVMQDIEVTKKLAIAKGNTSIFFIYKTYRNEKYWSQPLVFDPDRFLPEITFCEVT
ncbi:cytochrome P450 4p1-like [Vespa velutina]|uniref:cytochrome P450 4p1-like n=1 Tax=Vespa velutina TaxID=202808 RepID=UPI001FB1E0DF|nr:cytochrome P450 4p1-like [Vespa velutina]